MKAGYLVTAFDLNPVALERIVAIGGKAVASASDCAAHADIFLTSLSRPDHVGTVIHCGALGTGNVVKLVTNQLWFIAAAAIGEGFATGIANGVELGTLWHAIRNSVGDSFVARPPRRAVHLRRPL